MSKFYTGYNPGTNCRGLPSDGYRTPEPKHEATAAADSSTDIGKSFKKTCEKATLRILELREQGDPRVIGLPDEIKPTSRQYRKYRNKCGNAYNWSR